MQLSFRDAVVSTVLNTQNRGALVTIAAAFCATTGIFFFLVRILIRWPLSRLFGRDDVVATIATAVATGQLVAICRAVDAGLGKVPEILDQSAVTETEKLLFVANLLYVLAIFLSKLAVIWFFYRLGGSRSAPTIVRSLTAVCAVLFTVSFVVIGTQQSALDSWKAPDSVYASDTLARWIAVELFSDVLDLAILMFPIYLVTDLQMRPMVKFKVCMAFLLRLPIIPLSILRLVSLSQSLRSQRFYYAYVTTEIYTQALMYFTLVSATVPCLRIFLQAMRSNPLYETTMKVTQSRRTTHDSTAATSYANSALINSKNDVRNQSIELSDRTGSTAGESAHGEANFRTWSSDSGPSTFAVQRTISVDVESGRSGKSSSSKMKMAEDEPLELH